MFGVLVTFDLGADFDAERLANLARQAAPKFHGMPGLVSKTFTLDEEAQLAVNLYVWESEAAARRFFSKETLEWVSGVYGVSPALRFLAVPAKVENSAG